MSDLDKDINNVKNFLYSFNKSSKDFLENLKHQNANFYIKIILMLITICIYVICLVSFTSCDQAGKIQIVDDGNNFLFQTWYFVPLLTLTFICLIFLIYFIELRIISIFMIIIIYILFTLSIYYSYNNTINNNISIIMYSITTFFTLLFIIYLLNTLHNKLIMLLFVPFIIMLGFGIYIGVKFTGNDWESLINYHTSNYKIKVADII